MSYKNTDRRRAAVPERKRTDLPAGALVAGEHDHDPGGPRLDEMQPIDFIKVLGNPIKLPQLVGEADKRSLGHYFGRPSVKKWLSDPDVDRSRFVTELLFNAQTSLRIETGADALVADVVSYILTSYRRAFKSFHGNDREPPEWGRRLRGRLYRFVDKVAYEAWTFERLDSKASGPGWSRLRMDRIEMEDSAHLLPYRRTPQVWAIQSIKNFYGALHEKQPARFPQSPPWLGTDVAAEQSDDRVITMVFHRSLTPFAALSITLPDVNALPAADEVNTNDIPGWLWFEFYSLQAALAPLVWRLLRTDEALAHYQQEQRDHKAVVAGDWATTLFCRSLAAKRCLTEAFFAGLFGSHVVLEGNSGDGRHIVGSYIAQIRRTFVTGPTGFRYAVVDPKSVIPEDTPPDLSRPISVAQLLKLLGDLKDNDVSDSVVTWHFYLPDVFEWRPDFGRSLAERMDRVQQLRGVRCIYFFGVPKESPESATQRDSPLPWEDLLERTIKAAPVVHVPAVGEREEDIRAILGQWLREPLPGEEERAFTQYSIEKDVLEELAKGMSNFATFAQAYAGFEDLCKTARTLANLTAESSDKRILLDAGRLTAIETLAAEGKAGNAGPYFGREVTLASARAVSLWQELQEKDSGTFDSRLKEPFQRRELREEEMRWIISEALKQTDGNYRRAATLLHAYVGCGSDSEKDKAYKRFMAFLKGTDLRVDYKQFRPNGQD